MARMCPKCGGKTNGKRCLHCGPLPRAQMTKQVRTTSAKTLAEVRDATWPEVVDADDDWPPLVVVKTGVR
jgi:hypothetical protein